MNWINRELFVLLAMIAGTALVLSIVSSCAAQPDREAVDVAKLEIHLREAQHERDRAKADLAWEQQTSHILRVLNDLQKRECPPK